MKNNRIIWMIVLSALIMTSCSSKSDDGVTVNEKQFKPLISINLTNEQQQYVNKTNDFAFHLTTAVTKKDKNNVLLSPLSAAYVLGMLENGANGNTRSQIISALGFGNNDDNTVNDYFNRLLTGAPKVDESVTIDIANAVIADKQFPLKSEYVNTVCNQYQASVENVDFNNTDVASKVNNWASDHTNGMIKKILDQVGPDACMYAMNAIYFKGVWSNEFDEKNTKTETFTAEDGTKEDVKMMHRNDYLLYTANDIYSVVQLPYGNGGYRMMLILPAEGKNIDNVLASLDGSSWMATLNNMINYDVDLTLPRFSTEFNITMNEALENLGITDAFDKNKADFSRLSDVSAYLSRVLQKCKMDVDEKGTESAAVTVAEMVDMANIETTVHKADFHANRPFIYLITEHTTGSIYFIGIKSK